MGGGRRLEGKKGRNEARREGQRVAGVENRREKVEEETLGAEGMEDHSHAQLTWC